MERIRKKSKFGTKNEKVNKETYPSNFSIK